MTITCECDRCKKLCTPGEMYVMQTRQLVRELDIDLSYDICVKCRSDIIGWVSDGTQTPTS